MSRQKQKSDRLTQTVANIAEFEIAKLKARIAELEAELAHWRAGRQPEKTSVTLDQPGLSNRVTPPRRTPASFQMEREYFRKQEMRAAMKVAERSVEDAWHRAPLSEIVDSPEARVFAKEMALYKHPLYKAQALARAVARAELRARWATEDEAQAAIDLPAHITRMR